MEKEKLMKLISGLGVGIGVGTCMGVAMDNIILGIFIVAFMGITTNWAYLTGRLKRRST